MNSSLTKKDSLLIYSLLFACVIWISFFTPFSPAVDLEAYWMTGYNLAHGHALYAVGDRPGISIQKYSPWMSLLFLPIGFFEFQTSKWIWAGFQIISYATILRWCFKRAYKVELVALTFFSYWGIFAIASADGYVSPIYLALLLWAFDHLKTKKESIAVILITFLYSARIFQVLSLIGLPKKNITRKNIVRTGIVFIVLTLLLTVYSKSGIPFMIVKEWIDNANTTPMFATEFRNYGFPAGVLRILKVEPVNFVPSLVLSALFTIPALFYFPKYTKRFSDLERFMTALGVSLMVSPMTWKSTYLFAFPLSLMALDSAWRAKDKKLIGIAILSTAMVGFVTSNVFGTTVGSFFEMISCKSFGVLGSIVVIWILRKKQPA